MIAKIKGWLRHNRFAVSASCMMMMLMCSAFALDDQAASFDLATTMTSSVQTIVNDLLKMIAAVLPVTVTLLAAAVGITYGITFIRKILNKSHG